MAEAEEREGIADNIMDKQSAFFGSSQLYRDCDLAGPAVPSALHIRNIENTESLGGMRRPDRSVKLIEGYKTIGKELYDMATQVISDNPEALGVVQDLRLGTEVTGFSESITSSFRDLWFQTLGVPVPQRVPGPDGDVIEAWGQAVGDPDASEILPRWLRHGAPIRILETIDLAGIFPRVEPTDSVRDPDTLHSELAGWSNYSSAEDEPDVVANLLEA